MFCYRGNTPASFNRIPKYLHHINKIWQKVKQNVRANALYGNISVMMKMIAPSTKKTIEILLVEDNLADIIFTQKAFQKSTMNFNIHSVRDGEEAIDFLYRQGKYESSKRPNLILLDINLPKMSGHEVLEAIKRDSQLKTIPVIMLTSSDSESDISKSYSLSANFYWVKPSSVAKFSEMVQYIESFWFRGFCDE